MKGFIGALLVLLAVPAEAAIVREFHCDVLEAVAHSTLQLKMLGDTEEEIKDTMVASIIRAPDDIRYRMLEVYGYIEAVIEMAFKLPEDELPGLPESSRVACLLNLGKTIEKEQ